MADNRGNPSGSNTNMPNGVTRPKNTQDTQVSKGVLEAISNVLGTPLKTIQSNTSKNVKSTDDIKKELLKFTKKLPNDSKSVDDKKKKKDLMDFSDKKGKDEKIKESKSMIKGLMSGTNKLFKGFANTMKGIFDKSKNSLQGVLGPLNLILSPIQDFFGKGVFGKVFTTLGNGIKGIFGKFKKKNPNVNDVAKSGAFGVGSLYIVSEIKKIFGKGNEKKNLLSELLKEKGLKGISSILGAKMGGVGKFLSMSHGAVAGGLGILGGGALMAKDAMKGAKMAGQEGWSESKVSSAMGGLLGGFDSGFRGAFKNMGKWALMGFGIGNIACPIVGGIIGGLLGGAIGGILGWIGGAKISKAIDKVGSWFKDKLWGAFLKPLIWEIFNVDKFIEIFKSDDSVGKKIGKALGLAVVTIFTASFKLISKAKNVMTSLITKSLIKSKSVIKAIGDFGATIFNGMSNAWDKTKNFASNAWNKATEGTSKVWNSIKDFGGDVWEGIKESELASFVSSLFTSLKDGIVEFFKENPISKWMDSVIGGIKDAFIKMGAWFSYIGDAYDKDGLKGALNAMTFGMHKTDKSTGLTEFEAYKQSLLNPTSVTEVEDAIIRTDGSIVKTNPKDTLVALKDIPLSINKVRDETNKNLNGSLSQMERDGTLENKLTTIIDVLSKILEKDLQVQLPPQTRSDLDLLMQGALV